MHIHPSSPNSSQALPEEAAATKIQAGFRGYRVRKQLKDSDSNRKPTMQTRSSVNHQSNNNKENKRINQHHQPRKGSIEEKSATKIQAGIRGFLVRKKQKVATDAATKIQASFRGFKVRKEIMKNRK